MIDALLAEIEARANDIPADIRANWDGSNHYELTKPSGSPYFWCIIPEVFEGVDVNWCETEDGKRLGQFLDFGCSARTDIPRLVAALRVAVRDLELDNWAGALRRIEAALKGD